jgi:universal stress protein A
MAYKKILLATDFSPYSEAALQHASALASEAGATLLIVHVEEPPPALGMEMYIPDPSYPDPNVQRRLEALVPPDNRVRYEHRLLSGFAVEQIPHLAHEEGADLIVMGTHGRTGLSRILMGSVAEVVLRRAPCPVLMVKQPESQAVTNPPKSYVGAGQ